MQSMEQIKLLIVDDHPLFRQGLVDVVEADPGLTVVAQAAEGDVAIGYAEQHRPDIVLMDVNLPGINGLDATRQILAADENRSVVLLLSTYEEEEYAPRAAECGAAAYIPKSVFGPDRLEDAWAAARGAA